MSSLVNATLEPTDALPYVHEYLIVLRITSILGLVVIMFGLLANIINIIVFLKTSVKDSVTVLLLSLAVSDLIFLVLIIPSTCDKIIRIAAPSYVLPFHAGFLFRLWYWPAYTAYDLSAFISVSLGVMRCACVAMPLKFKFVFTESRTMKWMMFLVVMAVALRIPVLTIYRLAWRMDPISNISVVYVKRVNRQSMTQINDIMNRGIVIYINYITMVACVIILTYKLYQVSKIRRSSTATKSTDQSSTKTADQGLSSKDLQVVKSVVLVCTIFILAQLFFVITSSIRLLIPEFKADGNLVYLFGMYSQVSQTFSIINASLNIIVYLNFNSKFRAVFKSLFDKGKNDIC